MHLVNSIDRCNKHLLGCLFTVMRTSTSDTLGEQYISHKRSSSGRIWSDYFHYNVVRHGLLVTHWHTTSISHLVDLNSIHSKLASIPQQKVHWDLIYKYPWVGKKSFRLCREVFWVSRNDDGVKTHNELYDSYIKANLQQYSLFHGRSLRESLMYNRILGLQLFRQMFGTNSTWDFGVDLVALSTFFLLSSKS